MTGKWWIVGCGLFVLPFVPRPTAAQQSSESAVPASVSSAAGESEAVGRRAWEKDFNRLKAEFSAVPTPDPMLPSNTTSGPPVSAGAPLAVEERPLGELLRWPLSVWLGTVIVYFFRGWRQTVEGGGTIFRLAWVAPLAAAIALAPVWAWLLTAPVPAAPEQKIFMAILTIFSVGWINLSLGPPLGSRATGADSTLVTDETLNSRVTTIASAMGIRAPRLFKKRIAGRTDRIAAFAGGLPQPSVVVMDGVLHRLAPAERDAILAHEMAHIANHSLWPLVAIFPVGCAFAVWASGNHELPLAILLGVLFVIGLRRVVSRACEADCDRRAARVTGFSATISALYKVHAAHELRNRGLWSVLAYACATHPSREVRLSLLTRTSLREKKASDESGATTGVAFVYSARRFWAHRVTSCCAFVIWSLALMVSWHAADIDPTWLLLVLILAPTIFVMLALRPEARRRAKRASAAGARSWGAQLKLACWILFTAITITVVICFVEYGGLIAREWTGFIFICGLILLGVKRRKSPQVKFCKAVRKHDFAAALCVGEEHPKWRKNLATRYSLALFEIIEGEPDRGVAELEELTRRYPKYRLPPLALATVLLDRGQPERSLQTASLAVQRAVKDPSPHTSAARALRRLGRYEDARAAAQRALELDGEFDSAEIVLAGLALDAGSPEEAQRRLDRALDLSPGDTGAMAVQAEICLVTGDLAAAEIAINAVATGLKANPFWFMNNALAELEKKLAGAHARSAAVVAVDAIAETSGEAFARDHEDAKKLGTQ